MEATIAVTAGDGIGPEVTAQGVRMLQAVASQYDHTFHFEEHLIGGAALDATGNPLPPDTLEACDRADAILFGAVGGPQWAGNPAEELPERGLMMLRQRYELFANLRPVRAYPSLAGHTPLRADLLDGVDILIVRELTGGIYSGERQEADENGEARDIMRYNAGEIERVTHVAFKAAQARRSKVTMVDKANVLATSRLWRRVVGEIAVDYPDVTCEYLLVDACAMHLLSRPADFDVLLTANLFGDILSDEASLLAGSLGMLPSASLGTGTKGLYEPCHGSAPDIAGQGIANPVAALLSCALLLRHSLGLEQEAALVESAVVQTIAAGQRTADIAKPGVATLSTGEFCESVLQQLEYGKEK